MGTAKQLTTVGEPQHDEMLTDDDGNPLLCVKYSFEGEQLFCDRHGNVVTNPDIIARFKKTKQYRAQAKTAKQEMSREVADRVKASEEHRRSFTVVHLDAPAILDAQDFSNALASIALQLEAPIPYREQEPTRDQVEAILEMEAKSAVHTMKIWELPQLRAEYVQEHIDQRLAEEIAAWHKRKSQYEEDERETVRKENEIREEQYKQVRTYLESSISGNKEHIAGVINTWAETLDLPAPLDVRGIFDEATGTATLEVLLPPLESFPSTQIVQLKSGVGREKPLAKAAINDLYAECLFSNCIYLAANACNVSPCIQFVKIDAYAERKNMLGNTKTECVLSVKFDRQELANANVQTMDPRTFIQATKPSLSVGSNGVLKAVKPLV